MSAMETFMAYAQAFEITYGDDDWQRLQPYFAEHAVYAVTNVSYACRLEGPTAILAGIRKSLDHFDRLMDSRQIDVLAPPRVDGERIEVDWAVTYTLGDAPPLRVEASTHCEVRDGKIVHLEDAYHAGQEAILRGWLAAHAPHLDPSYT